jgi:hypothetical protein
MTGKIFNQLHNAWNWRSLSKGDFYIVLLPLLCIGYFGNLLIESIVENQSILEIPGFGLAIILFELTLYKYTRKFLIDVQTEAKLVPTNQNLKSEETGNYKLLVRIFGGFFVGLIAFIVFLASKYYKKPPYRAIDPSLEVLNEISYILYLLAVFCMFFESELLSLSDSKIWKKIVPFLPIVIYIPSVVLLALSSE